MIPCWNNQRIRLPHRQGDNHQQKCYHRLTFKVLRWEVSLLLALFKRFCCFGLPVLLVVLESFAGIESAARSTGELWLQLLQITLLPAHLGAKLRHLLHTQACTHRARKKGDEVQALEVETKRCVWFGKQTEMLSCFTCFREMFSSFSFITCLIFCFWFWWPSRRAYASASLFNSSWFAPFSLSSAFRSAANALSCSCEHTPTWTLKRV